MKKILLIGAALGGIALAMLAASPTYVNKSANGNASAGATVIFPADPQTQIRIVSANWNSDSNSANLSFTSGEGAYSILATNTTTGVTQTVNTVTGIAASDVLVLQHAGVCYATTVSSTNANGTNLVLASGAWGVTPAIGDSVYRMGSATLLPVGATTNAQNGVALYVATFPGRPVRVVLTPAAVTNKLNAVIAHYD